MQIVSELKVREAVGPLVDLLESPDASIRLGAFVALLQLTRIHFDYDPNGPEEERARFDARPTVVGETLRVNGQPLTIVGVAPPMDGSGVQGWQ